MSIDEETKYIHRIYKNDPVKYKNYVDKRVKIIGNDSSLHEGIVYTIDPVSESVILMEPKDSGDFQAKVIMGDSIKSLEILNNEEKKLPEFFLNRNREISKDEIERRKKELMKLLIENRISVTDEDDVLRVQGVVSIEPPYDPENCICANPIIMTRIQGIISQIKNN